MKRLLNRSNSLRIIYYHRLNANNDSYYFNTGITPAIFKQQLQELSKNFKIIPLSEAMEMGNNEFQNHLCISFDDGFRECYDVILPILKALKLKATFFITEKCINNQDLLWRNKLLAIQNLVLPQNFNKIKTAFSEKYHLPLTDNLIQSSNVWNMASKDEMADYIWGMAQIGSKKDYLEQHKPYMTESQIKSLLRDGFEIGCHTYSHPFCNKLNKAEIDEEIIKSSKRLADRFSTRCDTFSYPFGKSASIENEKYILNNSDLKILMGINDSLSNQLPSSHWERIGMERTYTKSMYAFYVSSRITSIMRQKTQLTS